MAARPAALVGLLMALLAATGPARAQYPDRPLRIVIGFPAGGGADILARYYGEKLRQVSGAAVIIDNRPGASGNLSLDAVAKAKPDGYTILMASTATTAGNTKFFKQVPFDVTKDFEPIAALNEVAFALAINPQRTTVKDVNELVAFLKAKQGKALYGWATTVARAASVIFAQAKGLELTAAPYKVTPDSIADVVGGLIDFAFADSVYAAGQEKQGRIKILAVTTAQRVPGLEHVPSLADYGVDTSGLTPLWAMWAPAGTPKEILAKLEGWFTAVGDMPETTQFLTSQGGMPVKGGPDFMKRKLTEALASWGKAVETGKIEPQ